MGNGMSEEEENRFMEEAINMSLDNPDVDKKINQGTTAPNCQPKHTRLDESSSSEEEGDDDDDYDSTRDHGHEVVASPGGNIHIHDAKSSRTKRKSRKEYKKNNAEREAQRANTENMQNERDRKLSYLQMAKLGYQELVNAIIRPPRAEYKVC